MSRLRPLSILLSVLALGAVAVPAAQADGTCDSTTQDAGSAQVTQQVCAADIHIPAGQELFGKIGTDSVTASDGGSPLFNGLGNQTVQIDWGDGTVDNSGYISFGEIDGYHTYAAQGTYDVKVTVTTSGTYDGTPLTLTNTGTSSAEVGPPGPAYVTHQVTLPKSPNTTFTVKLVAHNADGSVDKSYDDPSPSWYDIDGVLSPASPNAFVNGVSTTTAHFTGPAKQDLLVWTTNGVEDYTYPYFNVLGPIDHFVVAKPSNVHSGQPFSLTVTAQDAADNNLTSYAGNVPTVTDDSGTLQATLGSFSHGSATATDATIADPEQSDHITATDGPITGQSQAFGVQGGVDHFAVSVKGPLAPNQPTTVTVRALDANGHLVSGYDGSVSFSDRRGVLQAETPAPFVKGVSTSTDVTFTAPANGDVLTVTDGTVSGTSSHFAVVGPLDHFGFVVAKQEPAGESFPITVRALDAAGNLVKSAYTGGFLSDDSQDIGQAITITAGVGTYNGLIYDTRQGDHLTFDDGSDNITTTSGAFDVVRSVDHFTFTDVPTFEHLNTPFGVTIEARDANDQLVTAFNGRAIVGDTADDLLGTTSLVFTNGVASTSGLEFLAERDSGTTQLTAQGAGASGQSGTVTVRSSLFYLGVTVAPTGTTGHDFTVTATAYDHDLQPLTDYTGTPHLADTAGLLSQDANPAVDGVSTTQVHIDGTATNDRIAATDGTSPTYSAAFDVPSS